MSECGICMNFEFVMDLFVPMGKCKNEESGIKGLVPCYAGNNCPVFRSISDKENGSIEEKGGV